MQLGMCAQDTPILRRARAYTGSGIIYKGNVEGIGGGGAAPQTELVGRNRKATKIHSCDEPGAQPSSWAGVSTLGMRLVGLLAFS